MFKPLLVKFLKSPVKNQWLETKEAKLYVRKSQRIIVQEHCAHLSTCFDLASMEVQPKEQHKGIFRTTLFEMVELNPFDYVFVENVLNHDLFHFLDNFPKSFRVEHSCYKGGFDSDVISYAIAKKP